MTLEEKMKIVYSYQDIFQKIVNKNIPNNKFKEDLIQDLYIKLFRSKSLPEDPIEILKFSKTSLKNLMFDSHKHRKYKLISEIHDVIGIERNEDNIDDYVTEHSFQLTPEQLIDTDSQEEIEECFKAALDDCLLEAYEKFNSLEKSILVDRLYSGWTEKDLADKHNILRQTVKNIVRSFRQHCGIDIN
jgi:DNA-directed RNA polymerase specialized sigma24 family protein